MMVIIKVLDFIKSQKNVTIVGKVVSEKGTRTNLSPKERNTDKAHP